MITKTKAVRFGFVRRGIGLFVLGFYLFNFFPVKNQSTVNGITIPEAVYPYRIEGFILFFAGVIFRIFGFTIPASRNSSERKDIWKIKRRLNDLTSLRNSEFVKHLKLRRRDA